MKSSEVVVDSVGGNIEANTTRDEETFPPPSIIPLAELKVSNNHRNFRAGNQEYNNHNQNKTENIVEVVFPDRSHYIHQFNEDSSTLIIKELFYPKGRIPAIILINLISRYQGC